jgi:hypothetical protein
MDAVRRRLLAKTEFLASSFPGRGFRNNRFIVQKPGRYFCTRTLQAPLGRSAPRQRAPAGSLPV